MSVASPATWRNYIELPVHPLSVSLARRHTAHVLTDWGRDTLIDDAQLVISELVTNAIKASEPGEDEVAAYGSLAGSYRRLRVGLHQASAGVVLEVWDCSRRPPKLRHPKAEALGGPGSASDRRRGRRLGIPVATDGREGRLGPAERVAMTGPDDWPCPHLALHPPSRLSPPAVSLGGVRDAV